MNDKWQERKENGERMADMLCDRALQAIARDYAKYHRRESRRAKVVRVSQWVGAIVLGLLVGALLIGTAVLVGDIPLRGY